MMQIPPLMSILLQAHVQAISPHSMVRQCTNMLWNGHAMLNLRHGYAAQSSMCQNARANLRMSCHVQATYQLLHSRRAMDLANMKDLTDGALERLASGLTNGVTEVPDSSLCPESCNVFRHSIRGLDLATIEVPQDYRWKLITS